MYGLGKGGYKKDVQAKTKGQEGQWGVNQQGKRGLEKKKKVENKKQLMDGAELIMTWVRVTNWLNHDLNGYPRHFNMFLDSSSLSQVIF